MVVRIKRTDKSKFEIVKQFDKSKFDSGRFVNRPYGDADKSKFDAATGRHFGARPLSHFGEIHIMGVKNRDGETDGNVKRRDVRDANPFLDRLI